jgi:Fe(3+) dicitrate transport protein
MHPSFFPKLLSVAILAIGLCLLDGGMVHAQVSKINLSGVIRDSTGKGIQGASVLVAGSGAGTVTGKDGSFFLKHVNRAACTLEISFTGYRTQYVHLRPEEMDREILVTLENRMESLKEVKVFSNTEILASVQRMPDIAGTYIVGGRKNEVIHVQQVDVNLALKTGRNLFAKVPGVFVYDMDGSGNQVNIATRSLDAHRSWEFNVRHNGIITNSDMYGYPASHFSPPMESIDRVELVRGTASLQYGAQFGGMINYITRKPDSTKALSFESINTVGSYGLFSTYNAIGGGKGKWTYYGYYSKRVSEGYRDNSESSFDGQYLVVSYKASEKLRLKAEFGRSRYLYQLPGPLNDSMFHAAPTQSTRSRNWYSPDIYIPSLSAEWKAGSRTLVQASLSGVFGSRNSVQFIGFADTKDTINPSTGAYKPRQVDMDRFNSLTAETRIRYSFAIAGKPAVLATGIQYMHNDLHRRQQGKGTTGSDYDLTLTNPVWGRDLHFKTRNIALFAEQILYVSPSWSVSPGFRLESGSTHMSGTIGYYDSSKIPMSIEHHFPLFGISSQYRFGKICRIYGGISQAFRPVIFKDVIPATPLDVIDPSLKDARGYNAEIGVSGRWKDWLHYDLSFFRIVYHNRMGNMVLENGSGESYNYRTNTGNSATDGVEAFVELVLFRRNRNFATSVFTSTAWMNARYTEATFVAGGKNVDVSGNRIESAPVWTSRNGLRMTYRMLSVSLQYSYVGESFSDPLNTVDPVPNGSKGLVPSYGIWDLDFSAQLHPQVRLRFGMNNFLNQQYFTKRPVFYPDPGIWPSDGRNAYLTLAIKI